MVAKTLL